MISAVFGGSGQVGPFLIDELESRGHFTVNFDIRENPSNDIRDSESVRNFLEFHAPDHVFILSAQAFVPESTTNPARAADVTVGGVINVFESLRHLGMRPKILITGTSEEYGYDRNDDFLHEESPCFPTTPYGVFKLSASLLGQTMGRAGGFEVVSTRAWNHFGPGTSSMYAIGSFARKIATAEKIGTPVKHGSLEAIRDYSDVRDIVRGYADLMFSKYTGIYNLASGSPRTIQSVLELMVSLSKSPVILEQSEGLVRSDSGSRHFPKADISKIKRDVGWAPQREFEESVVETLEFWRTRV